MESNDPDVILAGVLRKKKSRINTWVERYFVLRGQNLEYFVKSGDAVSRFDIVMVFYFISLFYCFIRNQKV